MFFILFSCKIIQVFRTIIIIIFLILIVYIIESRKIFLYFDYKNKLY